MIIASEAARITENFYCLGPSPVPLFLLDGDTPVIFDAGIYLWGPEYLKSIRTFIGDRIPRYLFLTHMHFDHCGAAGYLKKMLPGLQIGASREGRDIIDKPSAVALITRLNAFGSNESRTFEQFTVDRILEDGERIHVSDRLSVQVIKTPGHTRDMLSYYIPELKILLPSESVGVPGIGDHIFSEFLVDYDVYIQSLQRLLHYDVDYLILSHGTYYTENDAREFIPRAIEQTAMFRDKIESLLALHGDDYDTIARIIKQEEYDVLDSAGKQPESAYMLNLNAKIKTIAKITKKKDPVGALRQTADARNDAL